MIKQAGTAGYVSISGRKIAGILLILICSFALAWAARGGKGSSVGFVSVKPARPLMAHTNHTRMGGQHVSPATHKSPATHNHSTATGQARTHQKQGALSNFNKHTKQSSSQAGHSKGAGQGANQGAGGAAGGGGGGGSGSGADQGAGQGAKANSETSPTPVPEESPGSTPDTTLGSSATMTGTSRWPRAAATPSSWAATPAPLP
jgi:hypothetical protein